MIKSLVIKYAKKYIINSVNELLEKNKDNVSKICEKIQYWTIRLAIVNEQLKKISARCSDGRIDDDEVNDSIKEIEEIVKGW